MNKIEPQRDPQSILAELGAEHLAAELLALAEQHPEVEKRVQLLLKPEDSSGLGKEIKRQITSLKRGSRFLHHRDSFGLAKQIDAIVEAIESDLLPLDPLKALELSDAFLKTDAKVFGRLDDSSGVVGDRYRAAGVLWLKAAKASGRRDDWVDRIHKLMADDNYSVREEMLDASAILLSEHELRRLARRYEKDAETAPPDEDGHSWARHSASVKMGQVGDALKDVELIERSMRLTGATLNDLQKLDLVRKELAYGRPRQALERLDRLSDRDGVEYWGFMADCRRALGDKSGLLDSLWHVFSRTFDLEDYHEILKLVPPAERDGAIERAATIVRDRARLLQIAIFFLDTDRPDEAERWVLERSEELETPFYKHLLSLADRARAAGKPRIEVVCYRHLLLGILAAARSKAYGHAARYFARLVSLDSNIDDYGPLPDYASFFALLKERHGRKHAFWRRVPIEK